MKKLLLIMLCLSALIYLTACFDEQPGSPIATDATGGKWSGDNGVEKPKEISSDAAYLYNNRLANAINSRTDGQSVSPTDIAGVRDAVVYMGSFNLSVHEESRYMEQLAALYRSIYNLYTGNCTVNDTHAAAETFNAAYDALSDSCKERMTRFDPQKLSAFIDAVAQYADKLMQGGSSSASSSASDLAVSSDASVLPNSPASPVPSEPSEPSNASESALESSDSPSSSTSSN